MTTGFAVEMVFETAFTAGTGFAAAATGAAGLTVAGGLVGAKGFAGGAVLAAIAFVANGLTATAVFAVCGLADFLISPVGFAASLTVLGLAAGLTAGLAFTMVVGFVGRFAATAAFKPALLTTDAFAGLGDFAVGFACFEGFAVFGAVRTCGDFAFLTGFFTGAAFDRDGFFAEDLAT